MPSSLPFWDPGATRTDNPNKLGPGIQTFIPEGASDPLPDGVSDWEVIYFNNARAPGICRVDGGRRRLIDHRGTPGASGEIAALMAYQLAEFSVSLTIWTPLQWFTLQQLVDTIYPKPTQTTATLRVPTVSVRHPAFQLLHVSDVYVVDFRTPRHIGFQVMEAVIDLVEFQAPVNEGVRQFAGAIDNGNGTFTPAPARALPPDPSTTSTGI
jgi:hypothetical protein